MGVLEFDAVFDELDSSQKGFVTAEQLRYFINSIFDNSGDENLIQLSIEKICGQGSCTVPKDLFYFVIEEVVFCICYMCLLNFFLNIETGPKSLAADMR